MTPPTHTSARTDTLSPYTTRLRSLQAFVHQLQRMQELVVEKLGGLLPGEMDLQLVLGHQAQRFFMRLRRFRAEPAAELALDRFAVARGQLERALVPRGHRDAVDLVGAVVVAGQRGQAPLFLYATPAPGQHAGQPGTRMALDGVADDHRFASFAAPHPGQHRHNVATLAP